MNTLPRHTRRLSFAVLVLCQLFWCFGCNEDVSLFECELTYPDGDTSPPTVTCPRQEPVVLEDSPAPGALCVYEPNSRVIVCDDESRFDASTGKRIVDVQEGSDMGRTGDASDSSDAFMDSDTDSGLPSVSPQGSVPSRQWASSSCTPIAGQLLCHNGVTFTLPSSIVDTPGECEARLLPGFGARIVCRQDDDTLITYIPDDGTEEPSCAQREDVVLCDDASSYDLAIYKDAQGNDIEECINPRLAPPAPPEVVAECMKEIECDVPDDELTDCYQALVPSQECEQAMTPQLVCGEEPVEPEIQGTYCYAPNGVYWVSSQESVTIIQEKGCDHIIGDVVVAPPQTQWEMEGEASERADIRWIEALTDTVSIHGSLNLLHTDLPLNRTIDYDEIIAGLGLRVVSGDLIWEDQVGIKSFLIPPDLTHVDGQMRYSDFKAMTSFIFQKPEGRGPRYGGQDLVIQSNPWLEELTLEDMDLQGSLVLEGNARLEGCDLYDAIIWAYDHAQGLVLIQALATAPKAPKNCLF